MSTARKLGLGVAISAATAGGVLLGALVSSGASGANVARAGNSAATKSLEELQQYISDARNKARPGGKKSQGFIDEAITEKNKWFIKQAFGYRTIHGCDAARVLRYLDHIDTQLEAAAVNAPGHPLREAAEQADLLAFDAGINCEGIGEAEKGIAQQISQFVKGVRKKGKSPSKASRAKVAGLKRQFLGNQTVYGCDTRYILDLLEGVDVPLAIARDGKFPKETEYEALLKKAAKATERLIDFWTHEVPCDEGGTGTTTTTTATTTTTPTTSTTTTATTTTTTTPSAPACSNGIDDDADGQTDFPNDQDCLSAEDTTEAHTEWVFVFPGDGQTITNYIDYKAFFGAFGIEIRAYRVYRTGGTVHDSNTPNHGATPINGTPPCAGLTNTGIRAGVGNQAPTGGVLPPAPDSDHHRVVIETTDPPGGTDCGTGSTTLRVAADTR